MNDELPEAHCFESDGISGDVLVYFNDDKEGKTYVAIIPSQRFGAAMLACLDAARGVRSRR